MWVLCALLAMGCSEQSASATAALEEALAGTRQADDPASATASRRPLAGSQPHQLQMDGVFVLLPGPGGPGHSVQTLRNVSRGEGRAFRIEDSRFWKDRHVAPDGRLDGRESVFDGEHLAVRRSWGPWMERETVGQQQERLLREAYDIAPAVLGAFGSYLRFEPDPEGETTLAGMKVMWERASLDKSVGPRPMDKEALVALREHTENWKAWLAATHTPNRIEGRLARRTDGTAEVVAGNLLIEGIGRWDGREREFRLSVTYEMSPLSPQASFDMPKDRLPPTRERPWKMVKSALGDDLLPPYRP